MDFRRATETDVPLLAKLNHALIEDEGHRNAMTLLELEQRMAEWLRSDYEATLFLDQGNVIGYALYRFDAEWVYLRQLFVVREHRRRGAGRAAFEWLTTHAWTDSAQIRLDVLVTNEAGIRFWRAVGFTDYCLTMEFNKSTR